MTGEMSTYAEIIKELHTRSGLQVNDYAVAVHMSVTHMSNILNGKQPGTVEAVRKCLEHVGLKITDCLELPEIRTEQDSYLVTASNILKRRDWYAKWLRAEIEAIKASAEQTSDHNPQDNLLPNVKKKSSKPRRVSLG